MVLPTTGVIGPRRHSSASPISAPLGVDAFPRPIVAPRPAGRHQTFAPISLNHPTARPIDSQSDVGRIRSDRTLPVRVVNVAALVLVLPGSKFLVLELVALAFGDAVQLGGFVAVTALIVALMLARGGMRRLLAKGEQ